MIFIDAEYVVQKMKDFSKKGKGIRRKDINWKNIIGWITGKRQIIRSYYYSSEFSKEENPQTYQEQQEYFKSLKLNIPYFEVRLGRLVNFNQGWVQKGVDVKISLDMFSKAVADQYDVVALVSGDSDFADVITEIKERYGKHVELYTFDRSIHEALRRTPDKHIIINPYAASKGGIWSS